MLTCYHWLTCQTRTQIEIPDVRQHSLPCAATHMANLMTSVHITATLAKNCGPSWVLLGDATVRRYVAETQQFEISTW